MEVIDLTSEDLVDDSSQYVDPSRIERQVFESHPMRSMIKGISAKQHTDYYNINSQKIPNINSTRARLEKCQIEQRIPDGVIFDVVSKKEEVPESIEQRLSRIKNELDEIRAIQEHAEDSKNSEDLQYIEELHSKLLLASQSRLSDLRERFNLGPDTTIVLPRITLDSSDAQKLLTLDQKIFELERIVGPQGDDDRSLMTRLESLFRQVNLLNNDKDTLAQFHEKLTEINKSYEDSLIGRRSKVDSKLYDVMCDKMTSHEMKVNELYKYHGLLEAYGPIFPQLLHRIKQISKISDRISETYELAKALNNSISDLQVQANKWEVILERLEDKLDLQALEMEKNAKYVDEKLKSLDTQH
ncbi:JNM1 (YMR294W) [Zygosaccharomyces parabailii]|nr:JNM1 (YMR294W) [Zygosaccharomyces parabailii]